MERVKPLLRRLQDFLKNRSDAGLEIMDCGVWTIAIRKGPRSLLPKLPTLENAKELLDHLRPTWTFIKDIYRIAPRQLIIYVLLKGWMSLDGGLSLYISGRLTNAVGCNSLLILLFTSYSSYRLSTFYKATETRAGEIFFTHF